MTSSEPHLFFSKDLQKELASPEAVAFRQTYLPMAVQFFAAVRDSQASEDKDAFRLDTPTLATAVDSAFLDLDRANAFHELKGGPSAAKVGAAISSWVNRLKPIQLMRDLNEVVACEINARYALSLGLAIKFVNTPDTQQAYTQNQALAVAKETLNENPRKGQLLLYSMIWRNPDFRMLSTVFELL